ncbi:unnamed protein product [Orchesella dallaii]|uniref:Uncharacterized protein n=1 Tax=Orchesella dallaii TaxID=48710 RepID=A0ABP1SAH6_9HEXA
MEGLFDEGFQPFRQTGHSKCGFLSTFGEIFLVGRDVIQSFTIAYFGIKTSPKLAVSMEVFRKNVMTVAAASNHTCKLPADARHWNERVDLAAAQRALV